MLHFRSVRWRYHCAWWTWPRPLRSGRTSSLSKLTIRCENCVKWRLQHHGFESQTFTISTRLDVMGNILKKKKMLVCKVLKRIKNLIFCRALIFFRITPCFKDKLLSAWKGWAFEIGDSFWRFYWMDLTVYSFPSQGYTVISFVNVFMQKFQKRLPVAVALQNKRFWAKERRANERKSEFPTLLFTLTVSQHISSMSLTYVIFMLIFKHGLGLTQTDNWTKTYCTPKRAFCLFITCYIFRLIVFIIFADKNAILF